MIYSKGGAAMQEYRADLAALRLIQVCLCLTAALITAAAAYFLKEWRIAVYCIAGVFCGSAVLIGFFCLPVWFSRVRCVVTSSRMTVCSGLIVKKEQSIRLDRIQFVQILSGPFNGLFGMNFIILHVYGGQLSVLFLKRQDRDALIAMLQQRGVFHAP